LGDLWFRSSIHKRFNIFESAFDLEVNLQGSLEESEDAVRAENLLRGLLLLASLIVLSLIFSFADVNETSGLSLSSMMENRTYVEKPIYPMWINASQIPIGKTWTFIYRLNNGSRYHIYFMGDWIGSKTDYDVYVFDPKGDLQSVHTEAAGLPEHLGDTVEDPFFTAEMSGDYYFVILNDPRESQGEDAATFMVIEHLECNRWYEKYIRGKVNFVNVLETTWAYEFASDSERIEVWIDVPETLDMYEARLYFMANPSRGVGDVLNGYPIPWESGLYGEVYPSGYYGGYNLDDEGFKHDNAFASCGFFGDDMLINYTSPFKGEMVLYHLVLIGENGEGTVRFMVKTDFEPPEILLKADFDEVQAGNETTIIAEISDQDALRSILLYYTNDSWASSYMVDMSMVSPGVYAGTIPAHPKGSKVEYKVVAVDMAGNSAEASGQYLVKDETEIFLKLSDTVLRPDEKIVVTGRISRGADLVILNFTSDETSFSDTVQVDEDGSFRYECKPGSVGTWTVRAIFHGDNSYFEAVSEEKSFKVEKISTALSLELSKSAIDIGGKVEISGRISPALGGKAVEIRLVMPNGSTVKKTVYIKANGNYVLELTPSTVGKWRFQAVFGGDEVYLPSTSRMEELTVNDTLVNMILTFVNRFMMYIATAIGGTVSAVAFIIYWRRRE
jgi:hypothetical protein